MLSVFVKVAGVPTVAVPCFVVNVNTTLADVALGIWPARSLIDGVQETVLPLPTVNEPLLLTNFQVNVWVNSVAYLVIVMLPAVPIVKFPDDMVEAAGTLNVDVFTAGEPMVVDPLFVVRVKVTVPLVAFGI